MPLCLTRKEGEPVYIRLPEDGRMVRVWVANVKGEKIRMAFDAPNDVGIGRTPELAQINAGKKGGEG